jgi:NAD(P)-dependent dehydrogenase (short-subunit alcohol dehydrogenase family)
MVAQELAQQYGEQGIITLSVNPGNIRTDIRRYYNPIKEAIQGVRTAAWLPMHSFIVFRYSMMLTRMPMCIAINTLPAFPWGTDTALGGDVTRGCEYEWKGQLHPLI